MLRTTFILLDKIVNSDHGWTNKWQFSNSFSFVPSFCNSGINNLLISRDELVVHLREGGCSLTLDGESFSQIVLMLFYVLFQKVKTSWVDGYNGLSLWTVLMRVDSFFIVLLFCLCSEDSIMYCDQTINTVNIYYKYKIQYIYLRDVVERNGF
jgi:hypothetical protein